MRIVRQNLHAWDVRPQEAIQIQKRLAERLVFRDAFDKIHLVAGCDTAFDQERAFGGVVVYEWPALVEIERRSAVRKITFPYIPGFLSFREAPVLLEAIAQLKSEPDVFIFDGHGLAHPRGVGIASHMGLALDRPAIGCAKSLLYGTYREPGLKKGDEAALVSKTGKVIGKVLRTRGRVQPIFVSAGHKICLRSAVSIILQAVDGTRIPKPTREADRYVEETKRSYQRTLAPASRRDSSTDF